ncbi:MAG: mechanosensitive ion channel [Lachnospiraceae bacterium]|nr:mechanosensitive ion channel [Lachnospiraceae bacterium]
MIFLSGGEEVVKELGVFGKWFDSKLPVLMDFAVNVIIALIVFFVGRKVIDIIRKIIRETLKKRNVEPTVVTFTDSLTKWGLIVVLLFVILGIFGITTASIIAVLGSAGLTIGLALQGSLSNFAGGFLILILRIFKVGEYICDEKGNEGTVTAITIFYTRLLTIGGEEIIIPNGELANGSIKNYSSHKFRRVEVKVSVNYSADVRYAKTVLEEAAKKNEYVEKEEPITAVISEFADSSVNMTLRAFVTPDKYWPALFSLREELKLAIDNDPALEIPFNQLEVKIHNN